MPTCSARPGLIVVDSSFGVVAYNGEALRILSYPHQTENIRQPDTWLSSKIRADLVVGESSPKLAERFRSARRTYLCRSFQLDFRKQSNGSGHFGGSLVVLLERKSNYSVKLNEMSERFGLSQRERETVENLLEGLTSKEIAQRMNISPNTVKAFLRLTMVKMNVSTRSGIIGRIIGDS